MQILVAGTVAIDDIKTPFGEKQNVLGGSAIHFSVAASFLSLVHVVGVAGEDLPKKHFGYLQKKGIDTAGISIVKEPTFRWQGRYEYDMSIAHTDQTKLGALSKFTPNLSDDQKKAPFLFLASIDPDLQNHILKQVENPRFVGLDSMNFWIDSDRKKLWNNIKDVDALFLNDAEIRQLAQEASVIKAARMVQKKGPKMVLVKKGEHGVLVVTDDFTFLAAAYPTEKVKDPTGAGDSFAGGFTSYLASKLMKMQITPGAIPPKELKQAVIWGAAVASYCVEDFSTSGLDNVTLEEIRQRCHSIHELTSFEKHE